MHFGIAEKPTTDCVSLYINAGLISKFRKKYASENAEDCRYRQPHFRLTPPPQETFMNIRQTLHYRKIESLAFISAMIVWVYLHSKFLWCAPNATSY